MQPLTTAGLARCVNGTTLKLTLRGGRLGAYAAAPHPLGMDDELDGVRFEKKDDDGLEWKAESKQARKVAKYSSEQVEASKQD